MVLSYPNLEIALFPKRFCSSFAEKEGEEYKTGTCKKVLKSRNFVANLSSIKKENTAEENLIASDTE